ncbi:S1 domain-containing protein [Mycoplasmopsis felis]|uniref:hypothetical protein n=1 Tax=Mycoplasmopsis felis TaxID=33923 RepID=UPI0006920722|nr:hypothetical protein [Mycoplasmopsis felis]WQQ04085.1 RNA-binding protein [Mycoplasmopsis felis]WQQ04513.1 RNA-binding protein [Mycoplasmopsis felis]WQQ12003.1 RNA-binding protein [Mycoplasmopsis felis]WRX06957.1 RNA-binding protein [Mycoplasmopsis felis]
MNYKKGDVVIAKIKSISQNDIKLITNTQSIFIITKSEITDFVDKKISSMFKLGQVVNFICLKFNKNTNQGFGSYKRNHPNEIQKQKSKNHHKLIETPNGFKNLYNYMMMFIENDNNK